MHTPGPWVVREGSSHALVDDRYTVERVTDGLRSVIAEVNEAWTCPEHGGTGALANARLIAAAPALYDAVRLACLIMTKGDGLSYHDRREAHEACIEALALTGKE